MIIRAEHKSKVAPYAIYSQRLIQDRQIPYGPKCLLLLMLSYPDTWTFTEKFLSDAMAEPIDTIQSWLEVLNRFGYFHRDVAIKISDSFVPVPWLISEYPIEVKK